MVPQVSAASTVSPAPNHGHREYLSYADIERDYPGTVKASTLSVWACTHRYDFHTLITRVGHSPRVRRDRWEAFLDSRTAGSASK